jgi:hypothetical protein
MAYSRPARRGRAASCWRFRPWLLELEGRALPSFVAPRVYDTGGDPKSAAVGDFNGDGAPDLAVANVLQFSGTVSVLLGNGDGSFAAARTVDAGSSPQSVAVGDFNGDGNLDLAVANYGRSDPGSVSVLLGNGDGSFRPAVNYAVAGASFVTVGDFTGDGIADLAVANFGSNDVSVLLGNGDGTFQTAVNYAAGSSLASVAVGDLHGDGIPDLVVANDTFNGTVSVLFGNGDGTFQAAVSYAAGTVPVSVALADLNGDGIPDLAVADQGNVVGGSAGVSVLLGNGDGTFAAARTLDAGFQPQSVVVGDFNGDGVPDLAVAGSYVSVLLGNGDGSFQNAPTYAAGSEPSSVAVGDFNGDGTLDLAVADNAYGSTNVRVLLGNGDGTFQTAVSYPAGSNPEFVAVGDFNGDSILDLAVTDLGDSHGNGAGVSVLLGNGDGSFQAARLFPTTYSAGSVAVGDFNGDGVLDLAVTAHGANVVSQSSVNVFLGNGDGTFAAARTFDAGTRPVSVAVGDLNGDGVPDLAVADFGDASGNGQGVSVLLGKGDGSFGAAQHLAAGSGPHSVALGDFTGDGILDIAVANADSDTVSVLLGNGDGSFQPAVKYTVRGGPYSVAVGDFNGDGVLDLAAANTDDNTVSVLLGNGDGSFQASPVSYVVGSFPLSPAVGDFNGDRFADLAVANRYSNDVSILLNDGSWGGPSRAPSPNRPRREPGAALAVAASPSAVPSDLVTADLPTRLGAAWPAPGETATQRVAPAEVVPPPSATAPAGHAADWVFAAPAPAGEPAPWWDGLPAADPDGLAWTRYEP